MTNLSVFNFDGNQVRIITQDGNPWFVAKDLCAVLDIKNSRDALSRLDDDEKDVVLTDTLGGKQDTAIVSESGMYCLVLSSRKPEAKPFRKWVTSVVLPELRKTGTYSINPPADPKPAPLPPADIRIHNFTESLKFLDIDVTNPRYKQAIQDLVVDKILNEQASLPGSTEVWLGVAEKAERLGYSPAIVTRFRSSLGRYVANVVDKSSELVSRTEDRLCNGTQRPIRLYLDCDELTEIVTEYMDAKVLKSAA